MGHLRSFAPWIAVAVLTGTVDLRWAALTGLLLALALVVTQRRAYRGWDALVIEASAVVFLAGYTCAAFAAPDSTAVAHYGPPLSSLWLAATAWGSLALGRPFTLGIARTQTPEHVWKSPLFLRVNRVITAVWAAAFTLMRPRWRAAAPLPAGRGRRPHPAHRRHVRPAAPVHGPLSDARPCPARGRGGPGRPVSTPDPGRPVRASSAATGRAASS